MYNFFPPSFIHCNQTLLNDTYISNQFELTIYNNGIEMHYKHEDVTIQDNKAYASVNCKMQYLNNQYDDILTIGYN